MCFWVSSHDCHVAFWYDVIFVFLAFFVSFELKRVHTTVLSWCIKMLSRFIWAVDGLWQWMKVEQGWWGFDMVFVCLTCCFALWLVEAFGLWISGEYARDDTTHTLLQIWKVKSRGKDTGEAAEWIKPPERLPNRSNSIVSRWCRCFISFISGYEFFCIFDYASLRVLSSICSFSGSVM